MLRGFPHDAAPLLGPGPPPFGPLPLYIYYRIARAFSTGKITQTKTIFLVRILSRCLLFDGLFYDSFLFHCLSHYSLECYYVTLSTTTQGDHLIQPRKIGVVGNTLSKKKNSSPISSPGALRTNNVIQKCIEYINFGRYPAPWTPARAQRVSLPVRFIRQRKSKHPKSPDRGIQYF